MASLKVLLNLQAYNGVWTDSCGKLFGQTFFMESRGHCSFSGKGRTFKNCDHGLTTQPLAQVFYSQSSYQINSVKTINTGVQYHSENYKQGFNWDQITEFVLKNLNTDMAENPLIEIFNKIVDSYKKKIPSEFGVMKLDYGKFNISLQLQPFGKYFEPELLKFFKICGSMMQAQCRWWNSGLLFGQPAIQGLLSMEVKCALAQLHNSCVGLK